jgi:large subunit ribosomal protein L21
MTTSKKPAIFAVIVAGGAQHLVTVGESYALPLIDGQPGDAITFDQVLLVTGPEVKIGAPTVAGVKVTGNIVAHGKTAKVRGVKFHNKVRYRRTFGHRQDFTRVKIEKIG